MLRLSLTQAAEGMELALPVYHPMRPGTILLRAGIGLDSHTIKRLWEMRIREVWIKYPAFEFLCEFVNPELMETCQGITQGVADAFDRVSVDAHAKLDYPAYRRAIAQLLERIAKNPRAGILVQEVIQGDLPALRHAGNVCLISVLMGMKLDFYLVKERPRLTAGWAQGVTTLGLGALLHDIGMMRLDSDTQARWDATHDETDPKWREHVDLGYKLVQGNIEPSASAVVQHHHQRYDGSGFPVIKGTTPEKGLSGSDIHVFARIVAAADLFDRLRHPADTLNATPEAHRRMPVVRALRLMRRGPYNKWIDPVVLMALLGVVPPYPPGSIVTLSNGQRAVVADWHPDNPCRPTVVTLLTDAGIINPEAEGGVKIDLRQDLSVEIGEIDGVDVSRDNFYPVRPGEFDLAKFALGLSSTAELTRA